MAIKTKSADEVIRGKIKFLTAVCEESGGEPLNKILLLPAERNRRISNIAEINITGRNFFNLCFSLTSRSKPIADRQTPEKTNRNMILEG